MTITLRDEYRKYHNEGEAWAGSDEEFDEDFDDEFDEEADEVYDDGTVTALGDGCAGWSAWLRTAYLKWPGRGEL